MKIAEFLHDVLYGLRVYRKTAGLTAVAVASLALGIGANTAIFSVVNAVLLEALPYAEPERIVRIWETFAYSGGVRRGSVSVPNLEDWRQQSEVLERIGGYSRANFNLGGDSTPVRVSGMAVTGELFSLLGVQPEMGRYVLPGEDEPGKHRVVVLSHKLWRGFFGADPGVVGRQVRLNGEDFTVVGVMPASFQFPPHSNAELWAPALPTEAQKNYRGFRWLRVVARLKDGVTPAQAQAEMDTITQRLVEQYPDSMEGRGAAVETLPEATVSRIRPILLTFLGAVGFVLLIGCANVANLLLAKAAARQTEFALRAALGAQRGRLIRQVLAESLLLSIFGGVLGLALGHGSARYLATLPGTGIPSGQDVAIDARVLVFCLFASVAAAVLSGLVPALRASKINLVEAVTDRSAVQSSGRSHVMLNALVRLEIALALIVLVGAGLMMKSLLRLQDVDPGLRPENVLTLRIPLISPQYQDFEVVDAFYNRLLETVRTLPGVESAGLISVLPIQDWGYNGQFFVEGRPPATAAGEQPRSEFRFISPGYFEAMGIPLRAGRVPDSSDRGDTQRVVVVNETLAKTIWPNEDPVGKRIARGSVPDSPDGWVQVIGVVGDVKSAGLYRDVQPEMYQPSSQIFSSEMSLVVHTKGEPTALASTIRQEVLRLDAEQPVFLVQTMEEVVSESLARWRFNTVLLAFLAALGLLLALAGVYGVMSYSVVQRTPEIGLRMALGARRADVLKLVVSEGTGLAVTGAVAGVVASLLLTRFLSSQLYSVEATDPVSFLLATLFLVTVAVVACYVPARRASRTDPMVTLRHE